MKAIFFIVLVAFVGCHSKIRPEYSVLVNYEYNHRTQNGERETFLVDFSCNDVVIDGISYDLAFVGCNKRSCLWRNNRFSLRHYPSDGIIKIELEYEKAYVNWDTRFAVFNVWTTILDP